MNVELPDDLAERAAEETAASFGGDLAALVAAAVDSYLTTQELFRMMAATATAAAPGEGKLAVTIDPSVLLEHIGLGQLSPADVISGKEALPDDVKEKIAAINLPTDLSAILQQGTVPEETAAKLPADALVSQINPDAIRAVRREEADEIEQVARAIAGSQLGNEELAKLARLVKGVAERVPALRQAPA